MEFKAIYIYTLYIQSFFYTHHCFQSLMVIIKLVFFFLLRMC